LFYYGSPDVVGFKDLLSQYTDLNSESSDFIYVLEDSAAFYHEIRLDGWGFSRVEAFDLKKVKMEHYARPDLPFHQFSKAELMHANWTFITSKWSSLIAIDSIACHGQSAMAKIQYK
jgi:hypothetical protein